MVEKICVVCKAIKPEQDFTKQRMYRRNTCKSCTSNRVKQYWKDNPEKYIQTKDLKRQRQHRRHGLSDETYASMLDKYDGLCYACREERAVCIDHDHSCCPGTYGCDSCVRGLLCQNCNWALGNLKDSVDRANKLIKYMAP